MEDFIFEFIDGGIEVVVDIVVEVNVIVENIGVC